MRKRKYIKKSQDGRYFLIIENVYEDIDIERKTKLWTSSDYLFSESLKEGNEKTKKILEEMIYWNEKKERYEDCQKLKEFIKKIP
jgi:hypothetical protein